MEPIVVITFYLFRRFLIEKTSGHARTHIFFKTEVIATVLFGKMLMQSQFVVLDVFSCYAPFVIPSPQIVSAATSWMQLTMQLCGRSSKVCLTGDIKGFRWDKHSYGFK